MSISTLSTYTTTTSTARARRPITDHTTPEEARRSFSSFLTARAQKSQDQTYEQSNYIKKTRALVLDRRRTQLSILDSHTRDLAQLLTDYETLERQAYAKYEINVMDARDREKRKEGQAVRECKEVLGEQLAELEDGFRERKKELTVMFERRSEDARVGRERGRGLFRDAIM